MKFIRPGPSWAAAMPAAYPSTGYGSFRSRLTWVSLRAGEGEVLYVIRPAVLLRNDVLDLICDEGLILLTGVAILATVPGPLSDTLAGGGAYHGDCLGCKTERALA